MVALTELLGLEGLGLRLVALAREADLTERILWVHSSDLADPTPWLEPGQVLLTDGAQFIGARADEVDEYVHRLRDASVLAIGFATEILHETFPAGLVAACERHGLTLLEVSGGAPFIGIIRHVADAIADERGARLAQSLDAHRRIARAAVKTNGLREILRTLSAQLDAWVRLYDGAGNAVPVPGGRSIPRDLADTVDGEARTLLRRGSPASVTLTEPGPATVQTIGHGGALRGALAVGTDAPLDSRGSDLVSSVIALASISLEQQRALDASRRHLRTGVMELIAAGALDAAERTAAAGLGGLPATPAALFTVDLEVPSQALFDELEWFTASAADCFFAEYDTALAVVASPREGERLAALLQRHGRRVGSTTLDSYERIREAWSEAHTAMTRAERGRAASFDEVRDGGFLRFAQTSGGTQLARRMLAPLDGLPAEERARLLEAARVWLEHNGNWDRAARSLGIHRHTLRSWIGALGDRVSLDLDSFGGRAELWTALSLADAHDATGASGA
ncbi:MAG: PucR family transcriptional regulator [Pseudoclavibacter sp.]